MKISLRILGVLFGLYPITVLALMAHTNYSPVDGFASYSLGAICTGLCMVFTLASIE